MNGAGTAQGWETLDVGRAGPSYGLFWDDRPVPGKKESNLKLKVRIVLEIIEEDPGLTMSSVQ